MYNSKSKQIYVMMTLINLVCVVISCFASIWVMRYLGLLRLVAMRQINVYYVLAAFSFLVAFVYMYPYEEIFKKRFMRNTLLIMKQNFIFAVCMAVCMMITRNSMMESRYVYVSFFLLNMVTMEISIYLFKHYVLAYYRRERHGILVGIVTSRECARDAIETIQGNWNRKVHGLCIYDQDMKGEHIGKTEVMANREDFIAWVCREMLDEVMIFGNYFDHMNHDDIKLLIDNLLEMGLTVHVNLISDHDFPTCDRQLTYLNKHPMVTISHNIQDYRLIILKRAFDILGGLVGCILSAPIILLVAIPLVLESPGGLFFKQKRVGLNGRYFQIYKLRSMYQDAEERLAELQSQNEMQGHMFKMENDPRVTKVGAWIRKTSIDELPQFFNVLKGDMSLVGTRPPTKKEFKQYLSHHKRRLSMKPGITGMWQVSGRSQITDFEEIVKLDLKYIDEWSPKLDLLILLKTVEVVFTRKGAE